MTFKRFQTSLYTPGEFTITYELVPGHGAGGKGVDRLLKFAGRAKEDGRIKALSITDNAGGHPALAPFAIGSEVQKIGIEPLVHFSLKDKNRNQVESLLFLYQRHLFRSLLVLGGDYPKSGYYGQPKPVFDLDSMQTIRLIQSMETGHYLNHAKYQASTFIPYTFLKGCVVSPFKMSEAEQVWQYAKLLKKIKAGANFIITQLGFDFCKFEELTRFLKETGLEIPVLANVFIPSLGVARSMAGGKVPGVIFPEQLLKAMQEEHAAKDREARLIRAAKMLCVLKGLGYAGVHIGGNGLNFEDVCFVMDKAEELQARWREFYIEVHLPTTHAWYLYGTPTDLFCSSQRQTLSPGQRKGCLPVHQKIHNLLFSRSRGSGRLFGRLCLLLGRWKKTTDLLIFLERNIKGLLFSCRMCGDCTIAETTYLCPQSECPKKLINGPCGGSNNMACEVYPDRLCFWVHVYKRLDRSTTIQSLGDTPSLPPKDWSLDRSSSWINYFSGRDHTSVDTMDHEP